MAFEKKAIKDVASHVGLCVAVGVAAGFISEGVARLVRKIRYDRLYRLMDEYATPAVISEQLSNDKDVHYENEEEPSVFEKPPMTSLVDYTKFYKGEQPEKKEEPEQPSEDEPEIISEEEFVKGTGNLLDGYVSVTGTYFTQEGILAGWDSDISEKDIDSSIGRKAAEMFDDQDVKAVYVRNKKVKVLYEIVRCNDPYDEAIGEAIEFDLSDPSYSG